MNRLKNIWPVFVLIALLSVAASAQGEVIVGLNENDGFSPAGIRRYNGDGNALSDFATGVSGFQSIDFDATTGTMYALWQAGTPRLASFDASGALLNDVALSGFSLTGDSGADISVHNGIVAVNQDDGGSTGILRYDVNGNALSDFATGVSGFQSVDFDATTGTLYALWRPGSPRLASFDAAGALLNDVALSGFSLTGDSGADIAVHNGIVALNEDDGVSTGIRRYDVNGDALSDFATGVSGFHSVDFDATTGTLYALWGVGSGRLASFDASGVLLNDVALSGFSLTGDSGADIAVYSAAAVPEPSSLALFGCGLGLLALRNTRRRRSDTVCHN